MSECVEAVSEWCRNVSIDTSVGSVECVQVSIDTGVKVSSRGSILNKVVKIQFTSLDDHDHDDDSILLRSDSWSNARGLSYQLGPSEV